MYSLDRGGLGVVTVGVFGAGVPAGADGAAGVVGVVGAGGAAGGDGGGDWTVVARINTVAMPEWKAMVSF